MSRCSTSRSGWRRMTMFIASASRAARAASTELMRFCGVRPPPCFGASSRRDPVGHLCHRPRFGFRFRTQSQPAGRLASSGRTRFGQSTERSPPDFGLERSSSRARARSRFRGRQATRLSGGRSRRSFEGDDRDGAAEESCAARCSRRGVSNTLGWRSRTLSCPIAACGGCADQALPRRSPSPASVAGDVRCAQTRRRERQARAVAHPRGWRQGDLVRADHAYRSTTRSLADRSPVTPGAATRCSLESVRAAATRASVAARSASGASPAPASAASAEARSRPAPMLVRGTESTAERFGSGTAPAASARKSPSDSGLCAASSAARRSVERTTDPKVGGSTPSGRAVFLSRAAPRAPEGCGAAWERAAVTDSAPGRDCADGAPAGPRRTATRGRSRGEPRFEPRPRGIARAAPRAPEGCGAAWERAAVTDSAPGRDCADGAPAGPRRTATRGRGRSEPGFEPRPRGIARGGAMSPRFVRGTDGGDRAGAELRAQASSAKAPRAPRSRAPTRPAPPRRRTPPARGRPVARAAPRVPLPSHRRDLPAWPFPIGHLPSALPPSSLQGIASRRPPGARPRTAIP